MYGTNLELITLQCCVCKRWTALRVDNDALDSPRAWRRVRPARLRRPQRQAIFKRCGKRTVPRLLGRLCVLLETAVPERQTGLLVAARKKNRLDSGWFGNNSSRNLSRRCFVSS